MTFNDYDDIVSAAISGNEHLVDEFKVYFDPSLSGYIVFKYKLKDREVKASFLGMNDFSNKGLDWSCEWVRHCFDGFVGGDS